MRRVAPDRARQRVVVGARDREGVARVDAATRQRVRGLRALVARAQVEQAWREQQRRGGAWLEARHVDFPVRIALLSL